MRPAPTRILLLFAALLAAALLVASPGQSVALPKTQSATPVTDGTTGSMHVTRTLMRPMIPAEGQNVARHWALGGPYV